MQNSITFSLIGLIVWAFISASLLCSCKKVKIPHQSLYSCKKVKMEVTAYCGCKKCCGKWADGITANGHKLRRGDKIIAAPKNISFGTKIYVAGYGLGTVKARGGAIKGNRLEVYFYTHKEALQCGRQTVFVEMR